jgi:Leu/Phe-tRNA-protein transferase
MAGLRRFEDIEAWKRARQLVRAIYGVSLGRRFHEDFALRTPGSGLWTLDCR